MNENYLWDKTGSDSEIEKLENALQAFRYAETAPPSLSVKTVPATRKTSRGFFQLGFAFAAGAVLVLIGAGVWSRISNNNSKVETDSAEIITPQTSAPIIEQPFIEIPTDSAVKKAKFLSAKKVKTTWQSSKQKNLKARNISPAVNLKNETTARNSEPVESIVKLTSEEKYAYNQLMLALWVTSSKLKIVKDKVDNLEKPNPVLNDGGR